MNQLLFSQLLAVLYSFVFVFAVYVSIWVGVLNLYEEKVSSIMENLNQIHATYY